MAEATNKPSFLFERSCERSFNRPSAFLYSGTQCTMRNVKTTCPFGKRQCVISKCIENTVAVRRVNSRFCKSSFQGPLFTANSRKKCMVSNTSYPGPLSQCVSFTVKSIVSIISTIVALLNSGCPTNISGFVMSIVVNSINTVSRRRARTDICKKCLKRSSPFVADLDSATAVSSIRFVSLVVAPCYNSRPSPVLGRSEHAVGFHFYIMAEAK